MKLSCVTILFFFASLVGALAQGVVPKSVFLEAQQATQSLADEVRRGNVFASIAKMYPRHKARMAKRVGSMPKLDKQLRDAAMQLKTQGMTIQSFTTETPRSGLGVWQQKGGVGGNELVATEWMVFVPTEMILRVVTPSGNVRRIRVKSFQVAIRKKSGGDWSFIDGSTVKDAASLRRLFPGVPQDLVLPKRGGGEIK